MNNLFRLIVQTIPIFKNILISLFGKILQTYFDYLKVFSPT